ncbi:MAG TPA: SET domain-containing protein-lysine N-methyltransferase [Acidobacteriaceae bacterium]|nr:SET domain-containing protein-lysine N-methyltransferase [Acidobacteriaceae bacterium]
MGLIIRSSSIHAAGCYTTSPIAKGAQVVEYTGPRISKEAADALYENSPFTYLFGVADGSTVIDGHGTAMFINHSCDPNCETDERDGKIWIIAIRKIAPGEELTYDYNLYDGDEDEARCNCGAKNCRKTMYSPEEIQRRKRAVQARRRRQQKARLAKEQPERKRVEGKKSVAAPSRLRRKTGGTAGNALKKPAGKRR